MARSTYIYTVKIDQTTLWIGTVKHEIITFLKRYTNYPHEWLHVSRYRDGEQKHPVLKPYMRADRFLENGGKFE